MVGNAGIPVWVIMSYFREPEGVERATAAFDLSEEGDAAAIAYYERHRDLIDAWLLLQDAAFAS